MITYSSKHLYMVYSYYITIKREEIVIKKVIPIMVILLLICSTFGVSRTIEKSYTHNKDGNTLYVGGDGIGNYSKIQDAIDNATDGDTVFVYNGTYFENITIDKTLSVLGENKENTIIDGGNTGNVVTVFADKVIFSGFKVQNSGSDWDISGILIEPCCNGSIINDNYIVNNYGGIRLRGSGYNIITDNTIIENGYRGIILFGAYWGNNSRHRVNSHNNQIINNIISNTRHHGIWATNADNTLIYSNQIFGNGDHGIFCAYGMNNTISDNMIYSNGESGIRFFDSHKIKHTATVERNNISHNENHGIDITGTIFSIEINNNNICSNGNAGLILWGAYRCKIIENNFIDNGEDVTFNASCFNKWRRNYWGEPLMHPKFIFGALGGPWPFFQFWQRPEIPWVNIDWRPALKPYDIGVTYETQLC